MNKQDLIRTKVTEYVVKDEMFTSVDISNAIKEDGEWISNRDVRDWLKANFNSDSMFDNYNRTSITVCNDSVAATLYHPAYKLADDYEPRNQHALTPSEVDAIKKAKSAQPAKSSADIVQILSTTKPQSSKSNSTSGSGNADMLCVISSIERIKIPGAIMRKLGYRPGENVAPNHVQTQKPFPSHLVVNKDYRFSIPRSCVGWDHQPVKVLLKKDKIVFEKA